VQVLTHLKEKLQFVQKDNEVLGAGMESLEYGLMSKRENLQQLKLERVGPAEICFFVRPNSLCVIPQMHVLDHAQLCPIMPINIPKTRR